MKTWGDIFRKRLALNIDHGYAAFAADQHAKNRLDSDDVNPCPECSSPAVVYFRDGVIFCHECGWETCMAVVAALFVEWLAGEVE